MSNSLLSIQTRVESPFIIVKIGDYTFGEYKQKKEGKHLNVTYPNYMESLSIVKVNGSLNTYTITMKYAVTENDDPNMLDRVFSSVSGNREITLSYGDWMAPSYIYKEEKAMITNVAESVDFSSSVITYTIKCVSTSLVLKSIKKSFNAKTARPSEEIVKLLNDETSGLMSIFPGMRNHTANSFKNLIDMSDKPVKLCAKENINVLDYIDYLVSCMVHTSDSEDGHKKNVYHWAVYDDIGGTMGGQYFKVHRASSGSIYNLSYNTYEIDIGYPSANLVSNFSISSDESWAILYNYSKSISQPEYEYSIDDNGQVVAVKSPSLTANSLYGRDSEANRNWWSNMTQFPIKATLTIKGLLRPAMLMSYVKINSYFYGKKHVSSGLYIVTKQEDVINSGGYKTTLSLTRLSGDVDYGQY